MTRIKNRPKHTNKLLNAVRGLLEHRATWLYLLLDEAEKRGVETEEFARSAIMRCGCFQGKHLADAAGTKASGAQENPFTLPARMVFEMKILACDDDRLDIDFHYCPLVAAWREQEPPTKKSPCFATSPCRATGACPFLRLRTGPGRDHRQRP